MRVWVESIGGHIHFQFQPDSRAEERELDKLLNFSHEHRPISNERGRTVEEGAKQVAMLGGHESQRWIIIDKTLVSDTDGVLEPSRQ